MRKTILFIFSVIILQSCIPLRIAPHIDNYKVSKGERFKRSLPKRQMFIFEDTKQAGHFYQYVNTKYELNDEEVYDDVPFEIEGQQYFFSFYEVDIPTKTINIIPIIIDGLLDRGNIDPILEEAHTSRIGSWYLAIEVYNDIEKDCLSETALSREAVLNYLSGLKKEYLTTNNYNELVFKN